MSPEIHFVGREAELESFRQMLANPYGDFRISLILGSGGIGKTQLVRKMLAEAKIIGVLAPTEPLDLFSTDLRHIDGIQTRIVDIIDSLIDQDSEKYPFADYKAKPTSEKFNACLRKFCKKKPLVLAFDTFENLDKVASNWIFEDGLEGLQVPGLICIVASRPQKDEIEKFRTASLVKEIDIKGLSFVETEEFFQEISNEFKLKDPLANPWEDLSAAIGKRNDNESLDWLRKITEGHPLRLEMAFRWASTLLDENSLVNISPQDFEKKLMTYVREMGETGALDVGPLKVSQPVFDTLICMGYVTRRFDVRFLRYLIDEKVILLGESGVSEVNILDNLEKYFFVKARLGNEGEQVLQLHDEMARLVREHIWRFIDPSGDKRQDLFRSIITYYDRLINEHAKNKETQNVLQIEKLYYLLEGGHLDDGKRLWFELAELDDDSVNSVLSGEIKNYKRRFDPETQYEIHSRIAQIEYEANHISQARGEWMQVRELGEIERRDDWVAFALFGLANCINDTDKALEAFLQAWEHCKEKAPSYLPSACYNIGFTYRKMQNIDKAIEWYKEAYSEYQRNPWDVGLGGKIANDLGYAYSHIGEWEKSRESVREGRDTRQKLYLQIEKDVIRTEEELDQVKDINTSEKLRDQLNNQKMKLSKAAFQLGLSFSTLGEIYRYDNDFEGSLRNYDRAFKLFESVNNNRWKAKTLFSMGEARRRIARTQYKGNNDEKYKDEMSKAQEEIQQSLDLCERYRVKTERDTANRRMGRIMHDFALDELEKGNKSGAKQYLEGARSYFVDGLKYARETKDILEELGNLAELAFIVDDFMVVVGLEETPHEFRESLNEFRLALDDHREDKFRIYQFPVFENLYKLEKAATDFQSKDYDNALKGYLEAFVGMASDPGYGRTRYKQHFSHLTGQIEKLQSETAKVWCNAFVKVWENENEFGRTLSQEIRRPDLVVWCRQLLAKIENQGAD